jgi:hypothetical protein
MAVVYLCQMEARGRNPRSLLIAKQQVAAFCSVFALGMPSYVAFSVAGRSLAPNEFTIFVAFWTLINTVLLGFFSPIEAQGPLLAATNGTPKAFNANLRQLSGAAGIYASAVLLCGQFFIFKPNAITSVILVFSTLSYLFWNEGRARLFGNRDLGSVFVSSLTYLVFFLVVFYSVSNLFPHEPLMYVLSLPLAWTFSNLALSRRRTNRSRKFTSFGFQAPKHDKKYLVLALAGFVALVPSAQGLILAGKSLYEAGTFSSYVGIVMLTRLGLTVINSITPTISLAYMSDINNKIKRRKLLSLHVFVFLGAAVVAVSGFIFLAKELLIIFLDTELTLSVGEITLVVLGECLLASTVATKTQLLLRGISRSQLAPWLSAAALYFLITYLVQGLLGLALAAIAAGALVLLWQTIVIFRLDSKKQD